MVDNKVSIILTVNSIIITLLMAAVYIAPRAEKEVIQVDSKILLNCGMESMAFARVAMLPHKYLLKRGKKGDYKGPLYAGNHSNLTLEAYKAEMGRIMTIGRMLYYQMTSDPIRPRRDYSA